MAALNKDEIHVGQLLHIKYAIETRLAVVLKKFDAFMFIKYAGGTFEHTMDVYYDDLNAIKMITEDGQPVFAKKDIFGRYKLKL